MVAPTHASQIQTSNYDVVNRQRIVFASCSTQVSDANPHGCKANFLHKDQRAQGEITRVCELTFRSLAPRRAK